MNQLFGYTFGSLVIFYAIFLVLLSIIISVFGKGIWAAKKENKGRDQQ